MNTLLPLINFTLNTVVPGQFVVDHAWSGTFQHIAVPRTGEAIYCTIAHKNGNHKKTGWAVVVQVNYRHDCSIALTLEFKELY